MLKNKNINRTYRNYFNISYMTIKKNTGSWKIFVNIIIQNLLETSNECFGSGVTINYSVITEYKLMYLSIVYDFCVP